MTSRRKSAFTVIELLTVIAIMGTVVALALPTIGRSKESAAAAKCRANQRQLQTANSLFASDAGSYVAAAADFFGANSMRWYGQRGDGDEAFVSGKGPLAPYLGAGGAIRSCPSFVGAARDGFEAGCGAYGYNAKGVGSRSYLVGFRDEGVEAGMTPGAIQQPGSTVMFADTAYPQSSKGSSYLIEYSFAEAYRNLSNREPVREQGGPANPSIHFRHDDKTVVAWVDGHTSLESMDFSTTAGFKRHQIGWFGGPNNDLFDPF